MHFSTTNRLRIKTPQEAANDEPRSQGIGWRTTATTIPIDDWLDNTNYNGEGPGTNQMPCWAIASGIGAPSRFAEPTSIFTEVIYYNWCGDARGSAGLSTFRYNCLLTSPTQFDLQEVDFAPGPRYKSFFLCATLLDREDAETHTTPATYDQNYAPKSNDGNGVERSLVDVVPLNSNLTGATSLAYPQVNNVLSEVSELTQTDGDPTVHSHKILLTQNTHTYKIKTNALLLSPDNLNTTLTLQIDQTASLDQVTGPYIIMEYLIKY